MIKRVTNFYVRKRSSNFSVIRDVTIVLYSRLLTRLSEDRHSLVYESYKKKVRWVHFYWLFNIHVTRWLVEENIWIYSHIREEGTREEGTWLYKIDRRMIEKCDLSSFSSCDLHIYILRSKLQNPWERRRSKINSDQRTRRGSRNANDKNKKKKKKERYRSCRRKGEEGESRVATQRGIKLGTRSNSYKMRMFRNVKHAERRRNRRACDDVRIPNRELQMSAQPSWRPMVPASADFYCLPRRVHFSFSAGRIYSTAG